MGAKDHLTARWHLSGSGILTEWTGVLAGPVAFAADELFSYAIVQWSCGHQTKMLLHLATLVTLALIAGGLYASWVALAHTPDDMPYDGDGAVTRHEVIIERGRFLAVFGILMGVFFVVMTLANAVPRVVFDVCQ